MELKEFIAEMDRCAVTIQSIEVHTKPIEDRIKKLKWKIQQARRSRTKTASPENKGIADRITEYRKELYKLGIELLVYKKQIENVKIKQKELWNQRRSTLNQI